MPRVSETRHLPSGFTRKGRSAEEANAKILELEQRVVAASNDERLYWTQVEASAEYAEFQRVRVRYLAFLDLSGLGAVYEGVRSC